MEVIRLFCSSMDVKPRVLLNHILRYMGFYTEEITETTIPSSMNSLADIFIVSDYYMEGREESLDIDTTEKTILICKDGWEIVSPKLHHIIYDVGRTDRALMTALVSLLAQILDRQNLPEGLLCRSAEDLQETLTYVAQAYIDNEILPSTLYTRCFYRQDLLYKTARANYIHFVEALEKAPSSDSDLIRYITTYAKFEFDSICQENSIVCHYPVGEMSKECARLLAKYPDNEQVRILQADIHLELDGAWTIAANEYGDVHLSYCSYAHYNRGRILLKYAEDYRSALDIQRWAIEYKKDYFAAWYQIALCLEAQRQYKDAVLALEEVCKILNPKYQEHLLAPMELEYLYKAVIKLAGINEEYLGDHLSAQMYEEIAAELQKEVCEIKYLGMVWEDALKKPELVNIIEEEMKDRIESACEKF